MSSNRFGQSHRDALLDHTEINVHHDVRGRGVRTGVADERLCKLESTCDRKLERFDELQGHREQEDRGWRDRTTHTLSFGPYALDPVLGDDGIEPPPFDAKGTCHNGRTEGSQINTVLL